LRDREGRFLTSDSALGLLDALFLRWVAHALLDEVRAAQILATEVRRTMQLLGVRSVGELNPEHVRLP
jgi:isopentenyl diphosphate isomerase/L-lactate dehydrogenase-like FMN-dependent dehydrogenase